MSVNMLRATFSLIHQQITFFFFFVPFAGNLILFIRFGIGSAFSLFVGKQITLLSVSHNWT